MPVTVPVDGAGAESWARPDDNANSEIAIAPSAAACTLRLGGVNIRWRMPPSLFERRPSARTE